ncbi:MAG: endopeptidase La [Candidatus Amulumruptor caecigallinarius]|nr:endopeptidase La [Candidatus Amulumruptor caecigallinarius]
MSKNSNNPTKNEPTLGGSIYYSDDQPYEYGEILKNILLLPMQDDVFMPYLRVGTNVSHPNIITSLQKAYASKEPVMLFLASDMLPADFSLAKGEDVSGCQGAIGYVSEITALEDGSLNVGFQLSHQGMVVKLGRRIPYMRGDVELLYPIRMEKSEESEAYYSRMKSLYNQAIQFIIDSHREQLLENLRSYPYESIEEFYFMIQNSPLTTDDKHKVLEDETIAQKVADFTTMLDDEIHKLSINSDIHKKTMGEIANRQREDFLRTQLRQIQNELGEGEDSELNELYARGKDMKWNEETRKAFEKEMRKLSRFNPNSPDYAMQYSYVDTFLSLPWGIFDETDFSMEDVENTLNREHYGLDKVKERIVEQMAVLKLRKDMKAPILCLYGPPGVGKTSLGRSIAEALGRKYVRVALGGVHDESEIRGHRRTYLGAMPGRIIAALEKCGTSNPVMVLDEIDKIGADYKGDPATALLEALDPEQNCKFHDNFVDHDFDLSKVLFIATANSLDPVAPPLLDRMELICIDGYVEKEKIEIAKRHLIPKALKEHGFAEDEMSFTDEAIMEIISSYTRESGVRKLEKKISSVLRKQARLKASGKEFPATISKDIVQEYLGAREIFPDCYEGNDTPGIVTGLAWTPVGGEILQIESSIAKSKDSKLTLTGNLGDVMKESAIIALQYLKANAETIGINPEMFSEYSEHVHVPEGAVPKDGPSAGVTILTSLASTFTGRLVKERLAMTGEITLRGKVLPVGGIKEKILAAKNAGITEVLLCEKNRKDIEKIKAEYLDGMSFKYVTRADEVLNYALI